MYRPAVLPYIWMLLGAASFAVMSILTASLKDEVDWQWIAIARAGLAMTFAASMATAAGKRLVFFRPVSSGCGASPAASAWSAAFMR